LFFYFYCVCPEEGQHTLAEMLALIAERSEAPNLDDHSPILN